MKKPYVYCADLISLLSINYFQSMNLLFTLVPAVAVRDKLESLCRELQKQNRMLTVQFGLCSIDLLLLIYKLN